MKRRSKSVTAVRTPAGTRGIARALGILRAFSDVRPEWGLAELARDLGLAKPTALRMLHALKHEGLVAQNAAGVYRLGPAAIELGARAQRANGLVGAARPEISALARETGETCSVEILTDAETLILDEAQGHHLVGISPCAGTRWPAHATSTGKVLLAAALDEDPELLYRLGAESGGTLLRLTPRTITSTARLAKELARVTRQGYSTAVEELEAGYVALGAPVRNHEGRTVGAISVGGPSTRLTAARIPDVVGPLRAAADRISRRLGWQHGWPVV